MGIGGSGRCREDRRTVLSSRAIPSGTNSHVPSVVSFLKGLLTKNKKGYRLKSKYFRSSSKKYQFWNNVDTVQFLETGTSDRTHIGLDPLLKCSGFSLYPLSIFLNSPFKSFYIFLQGSRSLKNSNVFKFVSF